MPARPSSAATLPNPKATKALSLLSPVCGNFLAAVCDCGATPLLLNAVFSAATVAFGVAKVCVALDAFGVAEVSVEVTDVLGVVVDLGVLVALGVDGVVVAPGVVAVDFPVVVDVPGFVEVPGLVVVPGLLGLVGLVG